MSPREGSAAEEAERRAATSASERRAATSESEAELHGLRPGERDRRLARAGWTRRFVAGPPRLDEAVALYRSLGLEVRLERPEPVELAEACGDCRLALELFRILYTRRPS